MYGEENHVDMLHNLNISSSDSSNNSELCNNTLVQTACSFLVRTETKEDDVNDLYARLQTSEVTCIKEVGAEESDANMSQHSTEAYASRAETSKGNASVGIEFSERKKIVKGRQSLDMFHGEDAVSSKASSPSITVTEGRLLNEVLTEPEPPKTNRENTNGMKTSETNSCERSEGLKTSSVDHVSSIIYSGSADKVQHPIEDEFSLNEEEDSEGILSFYNETMPHSPRVSVHFKDSFVEPSLSAENSSKHAMNLECGLFTHAEQSSSDLVAETHVNVINQTPPIEESCKKRTYFRIIKADKNCRVYIPRYNPPTKDEILATLSEFCIPEYRHQEPFVSNVIDTTNKKEVGNKLLKICSTSVLDLQPFAGSLSDVVGIETWRKIWLQEFTYTPRRSLDPSSDLDLGNMKPALAGHREVIITPCKLPPSVSEVKLWSEVTQNLITQDLQENCVEDKFSSRKFMMPLSPGQESGSDDDISLTPRSLSFEGSERGSVTTAHSTPQVTSASHYLSSPSCTPIHDNKHKLAKMLLKRSGKGLKFNSPSRENLSSSLPCIRESEETATNSGSGCDAGKVIITSSGSPKLAPSCSSSGMYRQQEKDNGSEDFRAVESVQPANTVNLQSNSEVGGK